MILRPFFSYYGSKWSAVRHYPPPKHTTLIEPFAGSASYALHYPENVVHLVDADPVIFGIWDYLIKATADEIRRLPVEFDDVKDLNLPQEAKWLIGFWLGKATAHPRRKQSSWAKSGKYKSSLFWDERTKQRIIAQVPFIRHWKVTNGSYAEIPDNESTWFVDPPYQRQGRHYRYNKVDYGHLGEWCRSRSGQVIVCEQQGAEWLPFRDFRKIRGLKKIHSREAIWTNEPPEQLPLAA
jgi:site-specific DNA-adenine methylase